MNNLELWEKVRSVPDTAKKEIGGGRLKGMTDINPMWRIKKLTEVYGPVGIGWYYDITDKHIEEGANGEKAAFVDIKLYVKVDGEWSKGISGTGGSSFVAKEKSGLYVNDECYKMALTDAISVSCKSLGFGSDVYWPKDNTKYNDQKKSNYNSGDSDHNKITTQQLIDMAHQKGIGDKALIERYNKTASKPIDDVKFIKQEVKQAYYKELESMPDK